MMERLFGRWLNPDPAPPLLPRVASQQRLPRVASTNKLNASVPRTPPIRSRKCGGSRIRRIAAAILAIFLAVHLGTMLIGSPPRTELTTTRRPTEWADPQLDGDSLAAGEYEQPMGPTTPRLIPRIIHHLYNGSAVDPDTATGAYRRWRQANPGWELRFYDLDERYMYIEKWFPEYLKTYKQLRSDVGEQQDAFRYLALLKHGGVFGDALSDREDSPQLEDILTAQDTMVVGWDREYATAKAAVDSCRVRLRQIHHRTIAAAPGHPALIYVWKRIAANIDASLAGNVALDALERTGPGVFTDVVLKFASDHPPGERDHSWGVRFLPRSVFGVPEPLACRILAAEEQQTQREKLTTSSSKDRNRNRSGISGKELEAGNVIERGWKTFWSPLIASKSGGASFETKEDFDSFSLLQKRGEERGERIDKPVALSDRVPEYVAHLEAQHAQQQLYPVSAAFDPPFEIMTHIAGYGDQHAGSDVSVSLTRYGMWQPSVQPLRRPSLVDAIVGSLGAIAGKGGVVVDVGAGYGIVSLAAAARGHRVHAFELAAQSLEALESSVARNGFGGLVQVHKVPLGAASQQGPTCLSLHDNATWARAATGPMAADTDHLARGYSSPSAHAVDATACAFSVERVVGADAVPTDDSIGALRVASNGWEGFVIEGFLPLIQQQRPPVIALEWNPTAMLAAGYSRPLDVIHQLAALGYHDISHSGFICDERWYAITYGVRKRGSVVPEETSGLKQPTWCRLSPGEYHVLLDKSDGAYPETLLFVNKKAGKEKEKEQRMGEGRKQKTKEAVVTKEPLKVASSTTSSSSSSVVQPEVASSGRGSIRDHNDANNGAHMGSSVAQAVENLSAVDSVEESRNKTMSKHSN